MQVVQNLEHSTWFTIKHIKYMYTLPVLSDNKHAVHVTGLIVVACEYSYLYVPSSKEYSHFVHVFYNSDSFDISGQI